MKTKRARPKNISAYISGAPKQAQKKLREMRAIIRAAAPGAKEEIKYGIPAFCRPKMLVAFAGYEHHIGFYPGASPLKAFAKELSRFKTAKGSIQFSLEEELPRTLIRNITVFRVHESVKNKKKNVGKKT